MRKYITMDNVGKKRTHIEEPKTICKGQGQNQGQHVKDKDKPRTIYKG